MHIAILSLPSNFHCRKWAQALTNAGASVSVYTLDPVSEIPNVTVVSLPTAIQWAGRYRFPAYLKTAATLKHRLLQDKIDLLHPLHLTPFGLWGLYSGFRPIIPAAIGADVFDFMPKHLLPADHLHWSAQQVATRFSYHNLKFRIGHGFYRHEILRLIRNSDGLTCDNESLRQALLTGFAAEESQVKLIRWGIDINNNAESHDIWRALCRRFGWYPNDRLVLAPRGANTFYGGERMLEIFSHLLQDSSMNHRLVLLSAGYVISPEVEKRAQQLEETDNRFVFIRNTLNADEMQALWAHTDVFLSAPAYDGFSAAEAEGRWVGALPVLNDIPAHREWAIHNQNAWVMQPFSPEAVAKQVRSLLLLPEEKKIKVREMNQHWIREYANLAQQAGEFLHWAEQIARKKKGAIR